MSKKITKPNTHNTDPAYWERILVSYGLGVDQPLTDNSDDASATDPAILNPAIKDDFKYLIGLVDRKESFISGHEIKKIRGTKEDREIPEWSRNNARVRQILLQTFPKIQEKEAHRKRAGRWARFIYLYYRLMLPRPIIMKEMGMTSNAMKMLVRTLNKVSQGLTRHGTERKGTPSALLIRGKSGEGRDE